MSFFFSTSIFLCCSVSILPFCYASLLLYCYTPVLPFVYYNYRAGEGKSIDPSLSSQLVINIVRRQYGITPKTVELAQKRLEEAMNVLGYWKEQPYLVGDSLSIADITATALLSPLALIPYYRQAYPWLFEKIVTIHNMCGETLPPGLSV